MTEYSPATPGIAATKAAYSPRRRGMGEGSSWFYLDGNRKGVRRRHQRHSRPLVHAARVPHSSRGWIFSGTGMSRDEVMHRVRDVAKIGVNLGPAFGPGGETFNRFNFAMRRALVEEAVARLQDAFSDLQ